MGGTHPSQPEPFRSAVMSHSLVPSGIGKFITNAVTQERLCGTRWLRSRLCLAPGRGRKSLRGARQAAGAALSEWRVRGMVHAAVGNWAGPRGSLSAGELGPPRASAIDCEL